MHDLGRRFLFGVHDLGVWSQTGCMIIESSILEQVRGQGIIGMGLVIMAWLDQMQEGFCVTKVLQQKALLAAIGIIVISKDL